MRSFLGATESYGGYGSDVAGATDVTVECHFPVLRRLRRLRNELPIEKAAEILTPVAPVASLASVPLQAPIFDFLKKVLLENIEIEAIPLWQSGPGDPMLRVNMTAGNLPALGSTPDGIFTPRTIWHP